MVSFLLISYPAISQSVTVVDGDTLIFLPEPMVRQIMFDLEAGDFCKEENKSNLLTIEHFRNLVNIREQEYQTLFARLIDAQNIAKEKDLQIQLKNTEIQALKQEKSSNFWKGAALGLGTGVVGLSLILLL